MLHEANRIFRHRNGRMENTNVMLSRGKCTRVKRIYGHHRTPLSRFSKPRTNNRIGNAFSRRDCVPLPKSSAKFSCVSSCVDSKKSRVLILLFFFFFRFLTKCCARRKSILPTVRAPSLHILVEIHSFYSFTTGAPVAARVYKCESASEPRNTPLSVRSEA